MSKKVMQVTKEAFKNSERLPSRYVYFVHGQTHNRCKGEPTSLLYIGSAQQEGRLDGWFRDPNLHNAAFTLFWWHKEMAPMVSTSIKKFELSSWKDRAKRQKCWAKNVAEKIVVNVLDLTDVDPVPEDVETAALHRFWDEFGEPPVMNMQVPNRWDEAGIYPILSRQWTRLLKRSA